MDTWIGKKPEEFCDESMMRGYKRNQLLIDLSAIPQALQDEINLRFDDETKRTADKDRSKLFNYFIEHRLKLLMDKINEF